MDYPLHPITEDYADFTEEETAALRESLRTRGLLIPVAIWNGQIVDGRHRAKLLKELGKEIAYHDLSNEAKTEDEMRAIVRALNEHRRSKTKPLTKEEREARIHAALKADPTRSDREIARQVEASAPKVGKERAKMEAAGDVKTFTRRTDSKGRQQQARKPKPEPPPLPDVETMSLKEIQEELRSPALTTPERKQQLWKRLDALGKSSIPAGTPSADAQHKRAERESSSTVVSADDIIAIASRVRANTRHNDTITVCDWAIEVARHIVAANKRIGGGR
jgi:ParB-like chromosome segregation protein Spo0J